MRAPSATRIPVAARARGPVRAHARRSRRSPSKRRNGSDVAAPFGVGFHPYLAAGSELVDEALLTIPAERWIATDGRGLPIGEHSVEESEMDFRAERQIGQAQLDTAFTDLTRDPDGRTVVILRNQRSAGRSRVWMDEAFRYVHGLHRRHAGSGGAPSAWRRDRADDVPAERVPLGHRCIRLEPGGSWRGRWGISVEEGS